MKKLIHIVAAGLVAMVPFNTKAQSVKYTYEKNDPFDIRNFSASIDPFFFELNGHNANSGSTGYAFGWGVRAEHMMGKSLLLNFDSRMSFGTNNYRLSNKNTYNYFNMEGGIGLVLSNRTVSRNLPIILSRTTSYSGNYQTTTTVYIKGGVPAKVRSIIAFRLGVQQYVNTLNYDSKNLGDSLLKFSSGGTSYTYREAKTASTSPVFNYTETAATGTSVVNMTVPQLGGITITSLYGGFQFRTIHNLVIDVEGYGTRSNIRYSDFFIDVMYAPVFHLTDFKSNGVTYDVKYDKTTPFGWRIGGFQRHPKEQGFSFKWELGSRPGFKADPGKSVPVNVKNMYFMMTMGLYVPLKVKPIYMGDQ